MVRIKQIDVTIHRGDLEAYDEALYQFQDLAETDATNFLTPAVRLLAAMHNNKNN